MVRTCDTFPHFRICEYPYIGYPTFENPRVSVIAHQNAQLLKFRLVIPIFDDPSAKKKKKYNDEN